MLPPQEAKQHGCRNVLALRGDPPVGKEWEAVEGGFHYGVDLVRYIRKQYGDYFDIAVAGYPQTQRLSPEEAAREMQYLKDKVDAGATFIFTQMFYDIDMFVEWVRAARAAGITIPIVPGIMPIQTWNGFQKATSLAKITVPQTFLDALEPHKNNDEKVRELGTKLVADMCRQILAADIGIKGLHFYTMNLEKGCRMLLEELNLVPRVEVVKPLPWRQASIPLVPLSHTDSRDHNNSVPHPKSPHGDHPPHLLGQPDAVVPLAYRELGRVPQRSFRRLPVSCIWRARRVWCLDQANEGGRP